MKKNSTRSNNFIIVDFIISPTILSLDLDVSLFNRF